MINSHFFRNFTKQSFVSEQGLRGSSMIYLHGSYQGKSLQGSTRPRPEEGGTMSEGFISCAEVLLGLKMFHVINSFDKCFKHDEEDKIYCSPLQSM